MERKIEVIPKIHYEPRLICDDNLVVQPGEQLPPYYYRFKAVDDVKLLGDCIYNLFNEKGTACSTRKDQLINYSLFNHIVN